MPRLTPVHYAVNKVPKGHLVYLVTPISKISDWLAAFLEDLLETSGLIYCIPSYIVHVHQHPVLYIIIPHLEHICTVYTRVYTNGRELQYTRCTLELRALSHSCLRQHVPIECVRMHMVYLHIYQLSLQLQPISSKEDRLILAVSAYCPVTLLWIWPLY